MTTAAPRVWPPRVMPVRSADATRTWSRASIDDRRSRGRARSVETPGRLESKPCLDQWEELAVVALDGPLVRAGPRVDDAHDALAVVEAFEPGVAVALEERGVSCAPVRLTIPVPENAEEDATQRITPRIGRFARPLALNSCLLVGALDRPRSPAACSSRAPARCGRISCRAGSVAPPRSAGGCIRTCSLRPPARSGWRRSQTCPPSRPGPTRPGREPHRRRPASTAASVRRGRCRCRRIGPRRLATASTTPTAKQLASIDERP